MVVVEENPPYAENAMSVSVPINVAEIMELQSEVVVTKKGLLL